VGFNNKLGEREREAMMKFRELVAEVEHIAMEVK